MDQTSGTPTTKTQDSSVNRRSFLAATTAGILAAKSALGRDYGPDAPPVRYPDPDIVTLDDRFKKYALGNTPIQRIYHSPDLLWAEGPAWNGVGKYLVWSDIPNNRQLRWMAEDGHVSERFRYPSGNSNGNTFDFQGRQISCEHGNRRVVRYEYDGSVTVLADSYNGKEFNAPNDAVVHPEDGAIWFTDPGYGSLMNYEGHKADTGSVQPNQKEAVYRIDAKTMKVEQVTDEIFKPNGLCFSPDYKKLYVADTGSSHYPEAKKEIKVWDVVDGKKLANGRVFASMDLQMGTVRRQMTPEESREFSERLRSAGSREEANKILAERRLPNIKAGQADGIRCDVDGNVWSSAGWVGDGYDGVHVFAAEDGQRIGQIRLPEICSNVCFGGAKRNRLFMTASTSVYAVYVETQGAHIT
ncbi:SMP-30/gluconolactonase/LRE family protein [Thalassoroseus pseudoceratinae]|uniref:SMP-30/gluconolactonase/LRE family protein n=1 Tax=Thalassoroseus pseudoceratinae TaxID=2713176 RepID=UPI00197DB760|nr:SMP-30/gluconolactonase/LRE family protein [Thalassoroseus pseudoceratinae]